MTKKRGEKLKDQGSLINSADKEIRKGSTKNKKKRSKMDVRSASVEDPLSTMMPVPVVTPFVEDPPSTTMPVLAVTPSVEDLPSLTMHVPVITPAVIDAHENEAKQGKAKEKENTEQTPGFIFMCNGRTKPECYQNRVFGLPRGQVQIVEKINPGAKLFLFDFELKLLYGVYKASSKGELGLEPTAFNGKFPAQVRFEIFKECLPLTENAFKHAIKDNYKGSKFRQDLTGKQVEILISLFRPITAPTSVTAATTLTNVVTRYTYPVPVMEERFQLPARPPPANDSYLPGVRYGNAVPPHVSQSEQVITCMPYDQQQLGTYVGNRQPSFEPRQQQLGTYVGHGQPSLEPQHIVQQAALPHCIASYYSMEAHQPYLPENPSLSAQDPYARYRPAQEVVQMEQVTGYVSEHHTSELARNRDVVQHSENKIDYHSRNLPPASASQVAFQTHEQRDWLSSYQPHYPVTTSHHLHQVQHANNAVAYYTQNLPPASASHFPQQTQAQRDYLPHYQPYYPVTTNNDPHQVYADPLQRPVYGSSSLAEASLPVTSHYSVAGAATAYPTYH
ncbi:hypothetical protein EZV62_024904 [Acer yangbiense]|uniref:DCD domain-containing protein n=1 Tax=Acer yangbiense TaxID=1000413 RepID=A0A5C7GWY6_9ROSI|nr:hypothetical protein EZV62_024904 [Acer yangbiense]